MAEDIVARKRRRTPEEQKHIVEKYISGESCSEIGSTVGLSQTAVRRIVIRHGVAMRNRSQCQRRYTLNEAAFDQLNEHSAYWCGFLMADGCITHASASPRQRIISLYLSAQDLCHIESFRAFLGSSHPIRVHEFTGSDGTIRRVAAISIASVALANALSRYGVTERKTFTAKASDELASNRHFWRGCFDGDGSIYFAHDIQKGRYLRTRACISFVGSRLILEQYASFVRSISGTRAFANHLQRAKGVMEMKVSGRSDVRIIVESLYGNCTVALPRKSELAKMVLEGLFPSHPKLGEPGFVVVKPRRSATE